MTVNQHDLPQIFIGREDGLQVLYIRAFVAEILIVERIMDDVSIGGPL